MAIDPDIILQILGYLTAMIPDHLPQFSIISNMFGNISDNKSNILEKDWSNFPLENFLSSIKRSNLGQFLQAAR